MQIDDNRNLLTYIIQSKAYIRKKELYLLTLGTALLTWLFSYIMLLLGVKSMLFRYPISVIFSFFLFTISFNYLLKVWLKRIDKMYAEKTILAENKYNDFESIKLDNLNIVDAFTDSFSLIFFIIVILSYVCFFMFFLWINFIPGFVEELLFTEFILILLTRNLTAFNSDFSIKLILKHVFKIYIIIFVIVIVMSIILNHLFPEAETLHQIIFQLFSKINQ